jgi:hypothetical protein
MRRQGSLSRAAAVGGAAGRRAGCKCPHRAHHLTHCNPTPAWTSLLDSQAACRQRQRPPTPLRQRASAPAGVGHQPASGAAVLMVVGTINGCPHCSTAAALQPACTCLAPSQALGACPTPPQRPAGRSGAAAGDQPRRSTGGGSCWAAAAVACTSARQPGGHLCACVLTAAQLCWSLPLSAPVGRPLACVAVLQGVQQRAARHVVQVSSSTVQAETAMQGEEYYEVGAVAGGCCKWAAIWCMVENPGWMDG